MGRSGRMSETPRVRCFHRSSLRMTGWRSAHLPLPHRHRRQRSPGRNAGAEPVGQRAWHCFSVPRPLWSAAAGGYPMGGHFHWRIIVPRAGRQPAAGADDLDGPAHRGLKWRGRSPASPSTTRRRASSAAAPPCCRRCARRSTGSCCRRWWGCCIEGACITTGALRSLVVVSGLAGLLAALMSGGYRPILLKKSTSGRAAFQ